MSKLGFFLVCLFVLATGQASGQITQVATLPVTTTFTNTAQPLSSAAWNTSRNEIYVSYTNTIQVVDTSNSDPTQWSLKATIQLPFSALAMALSKDGLLAIANQQTDVSKSTKSLTLVDPVSGQQRNISLGDYTAALECAFSPDGKTVYVETVRQVSPFPLSVYSVDVVSGQVFQTWRAMGNNVLTLQATADGKVWELAENEVPAPGVNTNMLAVYNPDGSESAPDLGGLLPRALFISPDGMTAYVSGIIQVGSNPYYSTSTVAVSTADETVIGSSGPEPSFLAWPSEDVLYAYAIGNNVLRAVTLSGTIQWQNPTTPLNSQLVTHGLLANRQANGSDLLVLLRDGGLDVYTATQPPLVYSVVNGASFQAVTLAPGENITIFGSALGSAGQADTTGLQNLTQMGNTSASLDGRLLRLNYVSYGQINAYMPQNIGTGAHLLSVKVGTLSTATQQITVVDQNPALFQFVPDPVRAPNAVLPILMDGGYHILGDPTVRNAAGQIFGYAQIARGDVAIAWGTGGGITVPPISDSDISPGGLHPLVITPPMTACGVPVALQYSGRGPGFPSLDQFNFVVPAACQSGANDLTLGTLIYKGALWVK